MIEHTNCPRCRTLAPLDDGIVMFTLEDDDGEPFPFYWQCQHCYATVRHREFLTVFCVQQERHIEGFTALLPGGW